jgi:hypothetical protein
VIRGAVEDLESLVGRAERFTLKNGEKRSVSITVD